MSFFDLNNDTQTIKGDVVYDYRNVVIYNQDVNQRTMDTPNRWGASENTEIPIDGKLIKPNSLFYQVSFPNKSPNLTYSKISPSSYTATNLYLFGLLHNNITGLSVSDKDLVGELVIEHATNSYMGRKVYTCFLLKQHRDSNVNGIDHLFEMADGKYKNKHALDIELNQIIPKQTDCFFYTDASSSNHIFVFTTPIEINTASADFIRENLSVRTKLFNTFAPNNALRIQLGHNTDKGDPDRTVLEGLENNDVYIDCQPTGESDETIQAYNIPIKSEYSGAKTTIDFMRSAINLLMFLVISVFAYFILPPIYKKIVVDKINLNPAYSDNSIRNENMFYADTLIIAILSMYVIFSFGYGVADEANIGFIYIGFALSVVAAAMYSIIQVKKLDKEFMTTHVKNSDSIETTPISTENFNIITGTTSFLSMLVLTTAADKTIRNNFFTVWILLFAVSILVLKTIVFKTLDSSYARDRGKQTMSNWMIPILLFNTFILSPVVYLTMY